jgi:BASS family bile acid:Na+ symporter
MESSAITTIFLPLALGIIMLGLGLSLTLEDFKRVVKFPKVILIGLKQNGNFQKAAEILKKKI